MYVLCQRVCVGGGYVCVVSKAGDVQHEYVCMRVVCVWCACGVRCVCVCVCVCMGSQTSQNQDAASVLNVP